MPRNILDTSVLIRVWKLELSKLKSPLTESLASRWGQSLREFYEPAFVLTPIAIEFLAGSHSSDDLLMYRAFLSPFQLLDRAEILAEDWEQAKRFAERIPKDGKPRQLGDCIIAAIARRLRAT